MEILITKRFKEKYLQNFKKYFSIEDLVVNLSNKEHKFISLHIPFSKFKNTINKVAFRGVLFYYLENKIIPIFIFLKKDKKIGENISWKNNRTLILEEFDLAMNDIETGDFEIFEEN